MTNDEIRGAIRAAIQTIQQQAAGKDAPNPSGVVARLEQALVSLRMAQAKYQAFQVKKN